MDRIRPAARLGDELYRSLIALIESPEYPEGARLPPENALAKRFGVSRPTVRETLVKLRDEGFIASRRGAGSFVQIPIVRQLPSPSQAFAPAYRAIDSFEQIRLCYGFRRALEGEAAAIAAEAHSSADMGNLGRALSRLDRAFAGRTVGVDADFRFHLAVADATRNSWFVTTLQAMRSQIETTIDVARALSLSRGEAVRREAQDEHVAIHDAILRRDAPKAREAMRRHLTNTCDRIYGGPSL